MCVRLFFRLPNSPTDRQTDRIDRQVLASIPFYTRSESPHFPVFLRQTGMTPTVTEKRKNQNCEFLSREPLVVCKDLLFLFKNVGQPSHFCPSSSTERLIDRHTAVLCLEEAVCLSLSLSVSLDSFPVVSATISPGLYRHQDSTRPCSTDQLSSLQLQFSSSSAPVQPRPQFPITLCIRHPHLSAD